MKADPAAAVRREKKKRRKKLAHSSACTIEACEMVGRNIHR